MTNILSLLVQNSGICCDMACNYSKEDPQLTSQGNKERAINHDVHCTVSSLFGAVVLYTALFKCVLF